MARIQWILGIALAFGCLQTSAEAVTIRTDRSDSQYQGLAASNSAYSAVGRFDGSGTAGSFLASGTLIAPDWVLTAGHVVDNASSLKFSIGGTSYTANNWVANAGWNGDLMAGYDIALVHLSAPVTGVTPALRFDPAKFGGATELRKVGTAVGFGMTGTGTSGSKTLDGKKRAAQNVIDELENPRLFVSDFDNPRSSFRDNSMGSSKPVNLEGLIAPGDSGGGVFIDMPDGKSYLAGVNSFAGAWDGKVNSDYGDISGHTRVSAFNAWINSILGGTTAYAQSALSTSRYYGGTALDAPVPEPSSILLLALGGVLLLAAKRLRRGA